MRFCPGTACFAAIKNRTGTLSEFTGEDIDIIGIISCGGCPGRDAPRQAKEMIRRGAEVIFTCTCLIKLIPYPPKCAYVGEIADAISGAGRTSCDRHALIDAIDLLRNNTALW